MPSMALHHARQMPCCKVSWSCSVHGVILAGGPSDNPLARYRAMPAVELGEAT